MLRVFLILTMSLWLAACASSSTVIVGTATDAIDFNLVKVFYDTAPECEFSVVALIKIPGEYYSQSSIIEGFRQRAASVGAPAVQVTYIRQTGTIEFYGSARAIRCH